MSQKKDNIHPGRAQLTKRGWEKIHARIQNLSNEGVAIKLGISPSTAKTLRREQEHYRTIPETLKKIFKSLSYNEQEIKWEYENEEIAEDTDYVLGWTRKALHSEPSTEDRHKQRFVPRRPRDRRPVIKTDVEALLTTETEKASQHQSRLEGEQKQPTPGNASVPVAQLIGREDEVRQIKAHLASNKLVTLTGTGGIGKTRLAMKIKEQMCSQYEVACFVNLADINDAGLVAATVAGALGIKEQPRQRIENTLLEFLTAKNGLLILDNCEHLLAVCKCLAEVLLAGCNNLRILATSRKALGILGEVVCSISPLSFPDAQQLSSEVDTTALLKKYGALQLLVQRAQSAIPDFLLTPQNTRLVAQICQMLDGIPLAIELAAARVKMLALSQIVERLEDRFSLLTNGGQRKSHRHQTLRALIDWSYHLLNPQEQILFSRLSIFEGGFTLEAVEAVGTGAGIEAADVLDLLTSLAEINLIVVERKPEDQPTRYRLLETTRQYAKEQLKDGKRVRRKQRDFYLKWAEDVRPRLRGADQAYWLAVLEEEHANLRQALKFCLEEANDGEYGLRLAAALQEFWWTRGHLSEGSVYTATALAHSRARAQAHTKARADALCGAGGLACMQGDYPKATLLLEEGMNLARELKEKELLATALNNLGIVVTHLGDYSRASVLLQEGLNIAQASGDRRTIANLLLNQGNIAYYKEDYPLAYSLYEGCLALRQEFGDRRNIAIILGNMGAIANRQKIFPKASFLLEKSLSIARELEDKHTIATILSNLGDLAWHQGDYKLCRSRYEESMEMHRVAGSKDGVANCLGSLAQLAYEQGDYATACASIREALKIFNASQNQKNIMECLEELASLAIKEVKAERCARLFRATMTIRAVLDISLTDAERERQEADIAAGKTLIGEEQWNHAWKQGESMTMEEAIAYALKDETAEAWNCSLEPLSKR